MPSTELSTVRQSKKSLTELNRKQKYDVGKNILLNRCCILNNKIDKKWIDMSVETFKIKCKALFLT